MKKFLLMLALIVPMLAFSGCGGDEPDNPNNPDEPKVEQATLSASDNVVGLRQNIILSINYKTNNPNILVSWFDNGEKLNKMPLSEFDYSWRPYKLGTHELKAAITDGDKVIECSIEINVVECDLCRGIFGDSKEKIQRTLGVESNSDVLTDVASNITEQYYFKNNKLYKIYKEQNVPKIPQNKVDYTYPYNLFKGMYETYSAKFGTPFSDSFKDLDSSEDAIIRYGGYVYSGSMQISAKFKKDGVEAEIWTGPCRSGQIGFNLSEQMEKL